MSARKREGSFATSRSIFVKSSQISIKITKNRERTVISYKEQQLVLCTQSTECERSED